MKVGMSMVNVNNLVNSLTNLDNKVAYTALKQLLERSQNPNEVYPYLDIFIKKINNNSYIRTRGLKLISAKAKWDKDNRINEIIDLYLQHFEDDKPITSSCFEYR